MTPNETLKFAKDALDRALQEKKFSQELIKSLGPAILDALKPSIEQLSANSLLSRQELLNAIAGIKINVPKAEVPEAKITVEIPEIKVPQPIVNVTVPEIKMPKLEEIKIPTIKIPKPEITVNFDTSKIRLPDIKMPETMEISGWVRFQGYDKGLLSNPLPVQIRDADGKPVNLNPSIFMGGGGGGGAAMSSAGSTSVSLVNADGNYYNSDNPLPVSATFSGSTTTTLINMDGLAYNSDNPLPITGSITTSPAPQVSGYADSVNVMQYGGVATPTGKNETTDGVFRTIQMTDSVNSVNVVSTVGLTDTQLRASTLDVKQVSGSIDSVNVTSTVGLTDAQLRASTIDVNIVSGATVSVNVVSDAVVLDQTTDSIAVRQVSGATDSVNVVSTVGLTDTQLRASTLDVKQVSGTIDSVSVTNTVTVSATDLDVRPLDVGQDEILVHQVSGSSWSTNVLSMPAIVVTSITNTTTTRLDSPDGAYSAANPLPITLISGALTSTLAVGVTLHDGVDDGDAPLKIGGVAIQTVPTAVADGDRVRFIGDDLGRQLVRATARDLLVTAYVQLTNGTETTLIAGVASTFLDMVYIMGANNSDAAVSIDFRVGTGGSVVKTLEIPAYGTSGVTPPQPVPMSEVAQAWTADMPDISGTTVSLTALFNKEK